MTKTAIVTGGSSGIGKATCQALVKDGFCVFELSRGIHGKEAAQEGIFHLTCDVTKEADIDAALQQIIQEKGQIDLVVNCAGFGISGAIEFTDTKEAARLFDVDFFGTVRVNKAVIPHMRERKSGRIINISSVAAAAPIPFQAYYSAAKASVSSYTMALANELRDFGISVCAVQPGDVKTGFTAAREKKHEGDEIYGGRISKSVAKMEKDETGGYEPAFLGRYIARVAAKKRVRPLYTPGALYKAAAYLLKLLPARLGNWAIGKLYVVR